MHRGCARPGPCFSLSHALNMGGLTLILLNEIDACRAVADELLPLAERNKFPWPLTYARFVKSWLLSLESDARAGIEQMIKVIDEMDASVLQLILLTSIAERQMRTGQLDGALTMLGRAMNVAHGQQAPYYDAEIIRLRGEVLLAQSSGNAAEAEAAFRKAMASRRTTVLPRPRTSRRHKPGAAVARQFARRGGSRYPCAGLWRLHRGFPAAGSASGQDAARRAGLSFQRCLLQALAAANPRICRASTGVATWSPRTSMILAAFSTSAALLGASLPFSR